MEPVKFVTTQSVRRQPALPALICRQLLLVTLGMRPSPLPQGLSLKGEDMEVVRRLEVPPGWDTSKNGVSRGEGLSHRSLHAAISWLGTCI